MSLLEDLRRPEYTGENRCPECTALNLAIVGGVVAILSRRSRSAAALFGAIGIGLVWLRGYVVPYTPKLAPALVDRLPVDFGPARPVSVDGDPNDSRSDSIGGDTDPEAVLGSLLDAGVLLEDGDLYLDDAFEGGWYDRMEPLAELSDSELAEQVAAAVPYEAEYGTYGDRLLVSGTRDAWLTRPVAIAETAAVETLVDAGIDRSVAIDAAGPLRVFLERCPACESPLESTTIRNCCGGPGGIAGDPEREVLYCDRCETVLFEY